MKKYFFLVLAIFALSLNAYAITDNEVIQTAQSLYESGKSEQDIARELVAKGATVEQLQNIKARIEESRNAAASGSADAEVATATSRVSEGETTPAAPLQAGTGVYGSNVFRTSNLSFEPQTNIPTPQNYKLGAGDELIIDIYGASQLQTKHTISPDGMVTFSDYGPVKVSGLTIQEATRRIKQTYGSRYSGSQLMVTLGRTRSIQINIMGEVSVPGTYQLSAFATVFHALYMAGGITESGTLRNIKVFRNSKEVASVDLYTYLLNGKEDNVRLEDGDLIIVDQYAEHVSITGNVRRPMTYELKKGESLAQLVYYAGGFSANAYTSAVRVTRANGGHSVLTVKNDQFEKFVMADADSVDVEEVIDRLENTVSINGAVFRPGQYGLSDKLHTVSQLIAMADGPIETAFLGRGVLYRMKLDRTQMAVPVDLEGIINGTVADVELLNEDQLYIPDNQSKLAEQTVTIDGAVREPQTFPYAENESVEDLILRAGGLTKEASTSKVDIIRRKLDPKATDELAVRSEIFTIEINDAMTVTDKGFILEPFDEVFVRTSPAAVAPMKATITGEVIFGGTYELKSKAERLSSLVKMAGGLSQYAYVQGAKLIRQMNQEELAQQTKMIEHFSAQEEDSTTLQVIDKSTFYTVGINLEKAIANPGSDDDVILREGDVLYVPTFISTVKINGAVVSPNAVNFVQGKGARYYIRQAGGFDEMAKRSKAYIVYPSGKTYPAIGRKVIAGSEIVVPTKDPKKVLTSAERMSMATLGVSLGSTVSTMTSAIVLIINGLSK